MVRNKIISITMAALLSINSLWNPSPIFYESIVADRKTESQTRETEVVSDAGQVDSGDYGLADNTKDGAILHAWCWSFNTIKENLKDIAEAGFTTVQTSPANTCLVGEGGGMELRGNGKWYYHYQPIDWQIGNYQLGTRDDFKAMCDEADKYGVKIIVDVVPNHTSADRGAVKQGLLDAAGGMDKLYHKNWDTGCTHWGPGDRDEIVNYKYSKDGCPDVCTENPGFQAYYVKYLNDLIECGVDGFRYDTAKHIGLPDDPLDEVTRNNGWTNNFWPVALGEQSVNGVKLNGNTSTLFVYGEVLQDGGSRDTDYGRLFNLTASNYGGKLRNAIGNKDFNVNTLSGWESSASADRLVTWVESHDTYCNDDHVSGWMSDWDIRMCWAVIAARGYGTPLFYSRPDGSNGSQGNYWGNNKIGAKGNDQFKDPQVAACNHFRNAMVGESEYLSNFGGNDCLVIERGTKGVVIINLGSQKSNIKLNKVADGTYTEEISGKEVQVSGGVLNCEVAAGSIAVVYNVEPMKKTPKVTASKASGTFQDAFTLTLTASNATKATYSVDGGQEVEFTDKATVKIGEGANIGDKITVKVTAEGDGETFSETFTYTMSEAPEYKMMLRVKKSDFDTAPTLYLYDSADQALNGAWPGTAMTLDGDYYVFTSDSIDKATAILVCGSWRSTADMQPGLDVSGYMEYDKASNKFTTFTMPVKTKAPAKETEVPAKETEAPVKKTENPVKETEVPTEKPDTTKVPVTTTPAKATPEPDDKPTIAVSKEDGTSFSTETMDVKITLASGTKGTYSVDDGPEKSFTSSTTVEVGKGKIADSEVTLKVTASGKTETYTYKKDFDPAKATVKTSAVSKIKNLFEIVSDAAGVNTAAESDAYYATNPNGVGKEATITGMSSFTQDMLVARSGAWDVPNAFHGAHENSVADCYGLYAAWDDTNLYIGLEMVNTTDTWARSGDGPLSDGGKLSDVPVVIAINTGKGNAMTGKCPTDKDGYIWQCKVEFETRVDHLLFGSAKVGTGNPGLFTADENGDSDYTEHLVGFKDAGITYKAEDGSISPEIMHVVAPSDNDTSDVYDISKYKDAMTQGHDRSYDTFFTYTIPLKALNIDKAYIESNGIGIMGLGTRQSSPLDCIPHDPSMLDNTFEDYTIAQDNTSHEKEDLDIITVPLAAVGNAKAGGEGGNVSTSTKAPVKTDETRETSEPAKETKAPVKTDESKKTEAPTKIDAAEETEKPTKTEVAEPTKVPTATTKATPKPTNKPVSGPDYDGEFTVNFGADRSSPQYQTKKLTLKAIPYGGSGDYTYEFRVDGTTLQKESDKDSCEWSGTVGSHTIKVIVKDGDGTQITCEKSYDLETKPGTETDKPNPTGTPSVKNTPPVGDNGKQDTPFGSVTSQLTMSAGANKKSPQVAGTMVTLAINAQGGTAPYKYTITVEGAAYGNTANILLNGTSANSCQWTPLKSGTYKVNFVVEDKKGDIVSQSGSFKISSSVSISKFTVNKYKVKKGKKVKFSMAATSTLSSSRNLKYKIAVLKSGKSAKTVIRKYSKSKSYSWKPKKKGKYTIYLTAKDTKGNTKTVKLSKKVTVK